MRKQEEEQREQEDEAERARKEHLQKARNATFERIVQNATATFTAAQLRVLLRALDNLELIAVTPTMIRRRIKRMEAEGLIQRIERRDTKGGQQSNFYSFDGLIAKMLPHAEAALDLRKTQDAERVKLRRRKTFKADGAKLHVVTGGKK